MLTCHTCVGRQYAHHAFCRVLLYETNNQHLVSFSDVVIILINGNRTCLCCTILSVIILMIRL